MNAKNGHAKEDKILVQRDQITVALEVAGAFILIWLMVYAAEEFAGWYLNE